MNKNPKPRKAPPVEYLGMFIMFMGVLAFVAGVFCLFVSLPLAIICIGFFIFCLVADRILEFAAFIAEVNQRQLEELEKLSKHAKFQSTALKLVATKKD